MRSRALDWLDGQNRRSASQIGTQVLAYIDCAVFDRIACRPMADPHIAFRQSLDVLLVRKIIRPFLPLNDSAIVPE